MTPNEKYIPTIYIGKIVSFTDLRSPKSNLPVIPYFGFIRGAEITQSGDQEQVVLLNIGVLGGDTIENAIMTGVTRISPRQLLDDGEKSEKILSTEELKILEEDYLG